MSLERARSSTTVSDIPRMLNYFFLFTFALLATGCSDQLGDQLFDKIAFQPAQQLAPDADICRYFRGEQNCQDVQFEELFFQSSEPQIMLQALFFPHPQSQKLIIYFHGNGGHIYHRISHVLRLSKIANVFVVSYRGYGKSGGVPSVLGIERDAIATLEYTHRQLGFATTQTYIYGRSLGTAVAIAALADRVQAHEYAGVVLVSPFYSGRRMAAQRGLAWVPGLSNPFNSAAKVRHLKMPALFIHGTEDSVIPFEQGYDLYQLYPADKKTFKTIPGVGHYGLSRAVGDTYWKWIATLVGTHDLS